MASGWLLTQRASCWQLLLTRRASSPGSGTCTQASRRAWLLCLRESALPASSALCVRINQSTLYIAVYITHYSCFLGVFSFLFSFVNHFCPVALVCICTTPPRPLEATIACHDLAGQPPWNLAPQGKLESRAVWCSCCFCAPQSLLLTRTPLLHGITAQR